MGTSYNKMNQDLVEKYKVDDTILESYFKNGKNEKVDGMVFPLRLDNRQYCSPTDYQGDKPSCCGYTTAQMLESINWMRTGRIVQMDAHQIYAKCKEEDGRMGQGGTFPDLAMLKGLELVGDKMKDAYEVKSSTSSDLKEVKRVIHKNMFASVNMIVTKDIYKLDEENFVYLGTGEKAGGHSLVCCGYDDASKMFILQNHWGTKWGLKGFFLCPYDVWQRQCNIFCWYEQKQPQSFQQRKSEKKASASPQPKEEEEKKIASEGTKV